MADAPLAGGGSFVQRRLSSETQSRREVQRAQRFIKSLFKTAWKLTSLSPLRPGETSALCVTRQKENSLI